METKHTAGPWSWSNDHFSSLDGPANEILLTYTTNDDGVHCTNPADAPLIAAAPELLDALENITANLERAFPALKDLGPLSQARAAIAKARGEA